MLNSRGYVAEGSRSNIFLIKGKELLTPSLESGCLNGVTRGVILDLSKKYNIRSQEGNYTLKDLSQADEAFFTNSLIGVMPLVSLERGAIGDSRCGRLTKFFIEKYACLLK
jgi:branched-subunit amino acid aminotransferase/4-amino-4-deoxychorismate lyase